MTNVTASRIAVLASGSMKRINERMVIGLLSHWNNLLVSNELDVLGRIKEKRHECILQMIIRTVIL